MEFNSIFERLFKKRKEFRWYVIVFWTGDNLAGLDPITGRMLWKVPFKPSRTVIGIATPVVQGDGVFVSSFFDGAVMVHLHYSLTAKLA